MYPHDPNSTADDSGDRAWLYLASAAGRVPEGRPVLPVGFAERVIARLPRQAVLLATADRERLVSLAACLTLAASLVLMFFSWSSIEAAWSSEPPIFDRPGLESVVDVEPWP